jgi:hypothetical protein
LLRGLHGPHLAIEVARFPDRVTEHFVMVYAEPMT